MRNRSRLTRGLRTLQEGYVLQEYAFWRSPLQFGRLGLDVKQDSHTF